MFKSCKFIFCKSAICPMMLFFCLDILCMVIVVLLWCCDYSLLQKNTQTCLLISMYYCVLPHRRIADEYCEGAAVTKFPTKYFRMRREYIVRVIGTLLVVSYLPYIYQHADKYNISLHRNV